MTLAGQFSPARHKRGIQGHVAAQPCPCGSALPYGTCCAPWLNGWAGNRHAPTAEALMRSRYSAYVMGLPDYLLATWHGTTAPGELELQPVKGWGWRCAPQPSRVMPV